MPRFLRNPTELKSIKNISLLRQSISNANNQQASQTTSHGPHATSTIAGLLPQNATSIQHLANALVNVNTLKESYKGQDNDDEKPTDLSTSSPINDRGFLPKSPDCYP